MAVLGTLVSQAYAQPMGRNEKEKAAKRACIAGDFQTGIGFLADLYADTNDPTYIYNQARCYQQNDQPKLALSRFREYQRKNPNLTANEKNDLERYISECQALMAGSPSVTPAPLPQPNAPSVREAVPGLQSEIIPPAPVQPQNPGRNLRLAGIVTTSLGLASLGTAVTLGWIHNRKVNELNGQEVWSEDRQSSVDRYRTLAWAGYGIGAAAVATGVTLYVLGWQAGKAEADAIAWIPTLHPGEVSFSLRGAF